jgi:hypothetical protein
METQVSAIMDQSSKLKAVVNLYFKMYSNLMNIKKWITTTLTVILLLFAKIRTTACYLELRGIL